MFVGCCLVCIVFVCVGVGFDCLHFDCLYIVCMCLFGFVWILFGDVLLDLVLMVIVCCLFMN